MPDIDIDFLDRTTVLDVIKHVPASIDKNKKHNTGVYVQSIPIDPLTGTASIDYKIAEVRGYQKIDFLNVSMYEGVKDEAHLIKLMNEEPIWALLQESEIVDQLAHINGHSSMLKTFAPDSVEKLAAMIAMMRPAKRHLLNQHDWSIILKEIWEKPEGDEYYFKKAHAIAYAVAIVVQLNLLCEKINASNV